MKKQLHNVVILLAAVMLLAGCGPNPADDGTITVSTLNLPSAAGQSWTAKIVCSRGKHAIEQCFALTDTSLTAEITVPIGTWEVTLQLIDSNGQVTYADSVTDVVVYPNTPTRLDFQLKPASGTLKVVVDLGSHPHADYIMRARVYFNEEYKEIVRDSLDAAIEGEYELPPGSYNFNVALYTESFRVTDRIDPGMWEIIDIEPLSEQTVIWKPHLEKLTITAEIFTMPQAPQNLTAEYADNQLILEWEPSPSPDLAGYNIYWQPTPFEPYTLIGTAAKDELSFTHDLTELESLPPRAKYAVAAFSEALEGYRSIPATAELL